MGGSQTKAKEVANEIICKIDAENNIEAKLALAEKLIINELHRDDWPKISRQLSLRYHPDKCLKDEHEVCIQVFQLITKLKSHDNLDSADNQGAHRPWLFALGLSIYNLILKLNKAGKELNDFYPKIIKPTVLLYILELTFFYFVVPWQLAAIAAAVLAAGIINYVGLCLSRYLIAGSNYDVIFNEYIANSCGAEKAKIDTLLSTLMQEKIQKLGYELQGIQDEVLRKKKEQEIDEISSMSLEDYAKRSEVIWQMTFIIDLSNIFTSTKLFFRAWSRTVFGLLPESGKLGNILKRVFILPIGIALMPVFFTSLFVGVRLLPIVMAVAVLAFITPNALLVGAAYLPLFIHKLWKEYRKNYSNTGEKVFLSTDNTKVNSGQPINRNQSSASMRFFAQAGRGEENKVSEQQQEDGCQSEMNI